MNWADYHFDFASKFRLVLLATRAYNLINPEICLKEMQEYTSLLGYLSKDALVSECSRLLRIVKLRKLSTANADFPAPPPLPFKLLTGKDDCGCGMIYSSVPQKSCRATSRLKPKSRAKVLTPNFTKNLVADLEIKVTATVSVAV
jgi:hypothetical protein